MLQKLKDYLGVTVTWSDSVDLKGLPVYMIANRRFYYVDIENVRFLLISISENDKFGVISLKKQMSQYCETAGVNVAYFFERMTRTQRDAMIKNNIPFISLPEQVYLPFLGVILADKFVEKKIIQSEKMMPVTQSLFLYMLYSGENNRIMKSKAAEELNLTRTSITRASEQLIAMGLIEQEKLGKEIYMKCMDTGFALYQEAKAYLINPVQKEYIVEYVPEFEDLPLSGETALSMQTMLNAPIIEEVALFKGQKRRKEWKEIEEKWNDGKKLIKVQVWKYDPCPFIRNGCVDPVSLVCSLQENHDERVEMGVEELLEGTDW